jgi:hypothetical protein
MTTNKIIESAIELLEKFGYQYIYAPSIAPDRREIGTDEIG